ncbi:DUF4368 domain-containing protein [Aedoeadaptatus coxii]|uniref:DUF4368 domain-containing protein n=1 Tax=Aedoeadaptatus coxii TaxID=755172 RepID=UPI002AD21FD9|nr:DUF4368 domain-containing protein [Peptoniphilus coxii]
MSSVKLVRKYIGIKEIEPGIIRIFIETIYAVQSEKAPGTKLKKQTVLIYATL